MSETQFEKFLLVQLRAHLDGIIAAGERYQFRSSDPSNTNSLILVLRKAADDSVVFNQVALPYINISDVRLICVAHSDDPEITNGFSENYISMLRDGVAGQEGDFEKTALLIVHNSLLDTLTNSAHDLSENGSGWSPNTVRDSLFKLAERKSKSHNVFDCLLDWQAEIIGDEDGSVFGFKKIHEAIAHDDKLDLRPLGLLNDSGLLDMGSQNQIRRRLDDNRKVYEQFENVSHHFPDEIPERLNVSDKFTKNHFGDACTEPWSDLDYQLIKAELRQQDDKKIEFVAISSESCHDSIIGPRDESTTAAGKRRKHIILLAEPDAKTIDVSIEFVGDDLELGNVKIEHNASVEKGCQFEIKKTKNRRRINFETPFDGQPCFFRVRIDRKLTSERFDFRFLVVTEGDFHVAGFENHFLIKTNEKSPEKNHLLLQTDDRELLINPDVAKRFSLLDNRQSIATAEYGTVDYESLYEESDVVSFSVENLDHCLTFHIEGEVSQDSLTLPLLMDVGRFNRLFDDNYNGMLLPEKQRVVIDNQETRVVAIRAKILEIESLFIENKLLSYSDDTKSLPALGIKEFAPELYEAWAKLIKYFEQKKTVPSLASWGNEMIDLAGNYIVAYQNFLANIEHGHNLDDNTRKVMKLGVAEFDGRRFLSPFHPLVLSYYQHLASEITKDQEDRSFKNVPQVTRRRLNPRGLLPYLYSTGSGYSYTQPLDENAYWLEIVPQTSGSCGYVQKLTFEKIQEFVKTFDVLFKDGTDAPLLINSVNNFENEEIFRGILWYFRECGNESEKIHVNLYDDDFSETEFDRFAELGTYQKIKTRYDLDKGKGREIADSIIDLLRSRLTFSKFRTKDTEKQAYAHLTFFRNNQKVQPVSINIRHHISGVACDGLLNGEASCRENQSYFTGFGLKNVETSELPHLEIARMVGALQKPLVSPNESFNDSSAIRLAVSDEFRELLERSYDSSIWVTIIDPKVTLKFFEKTKDVVLIHFSDQYTNSAGYDAITVTKQTELYRDILKHGSEKAVGEFNAFNGEWLLKMVIAQKKIRDERQGIIGAWKLISCLLAKSDITWVPLSVSEMIRVSGNIGLKLSESDFSRYHKKTEFKGKISDDVLFAGFKDNTLYLLPVEVKTGSADFKKAHGQAKALKEYLVKGLFGPRTLEGQIYRSLFVRQILMQIEKYELYEVFPADYFDGILELRENWLRGDYYVDDLKDYPTGFVVAHLKAETHFETKCLVDDGIGRIELPIAYLDWLLRTSRTELEAEILKDNKLGIREDFFLLPNATGGDQPAGQENENSSETISDEASTSGDSDAGTEPKSDDNHQSDDEGSDNDLDLIAESSEGPLRIQFGTDVKNDDPVYWEPTNTEKVLNPNTAIIGTMGTGKTQFTKSLVTQLVRNQAANVGGKPIGILILDYKADYVKEDFVEATGAKVLELHKLPFNPFALFGKKPMLPVHTASQFRTTLTKAFGLGNKQQNKINSLVLEAYEREGIARNDSSTWNIPAPTLNDVWNVFQEQEKVEEDSLHAALNQLITFEIFEPDKSKTQSLYDMIEGVTVINLSGYDEIIQNLVVALTLDIFFAQMHQKGSSRVDGAHRQLTKFILVDEADNFMRQEFPGLRKLLKEGREFGVGTILSTQELTHFKTPNNDYSSYILSWIIHKVSNIKAQDVKSLFNAKTKDECDRLMTGIRELDKHYSLYVDGEKHISKIKDLAFWELD